MEISSMPNLDSCASSPYDTKKPTDLELYNDWEYLELQYAANAALDKDKARTLLELEIW
jgi:hypothetical protein